MTQDPSKRILLIHGELATQAEFRRMLCRCNQNGDTPGPSILERLEVDTVGCGREGLALVREAKRQQQPYLLAVVDLRGTTQPDCIETVRGLWSQAPTLRVLVCTAADQSEIARQFGGDSRLVSIASPPQSDEVRPLVAALVDRGLAYRAMQKATHELESARREVERAHDEVARAGRARSEFMANVSHEIRTPMNAILGFTRLLMKEPLGEDRLQKLRYVHEAGTSLSKLINNMLDFSKLAAGQLTLLSAGFNLDSLLGQIFEETRLPAGEKGLAIRHHVVEAVPRWLRGDQGRFRQILVSLIDNAIKFTDYGTIHVHITLDEQTEQTATLRAVVTDTGIGIPAQRQAIIFESFTQADGSATRQFGGVGLGLSLCKRLVDLMGGHVGFRSVPGQGSSFWLTLTFPKYEPSCAERQAHDQSASWAAALPCPMPSDPVETQPSRPHVLVADEEYVNRTLAEMLLTRVGCLVDLAGSGGEVLEMIKKTAYDLLLMDVDMLQMDGQLVVEHIRRLEATTDQKLPTVIPTLQTRSDKSEQPHPSGTDECIPKPFAPDTLIETVRRHLLDRFDSPPPETQSDRRPGSETPSAAPKTLEDYVRRLHRAFEREDFCDMEKLAGSLKRILPEVGSKVAVDQAMRVQLAARSKDLSRAATAIPKLQAVLQGAHASAIGVDSSHTPLPSQRRILT